MHAVEESLKVANEDKEVLTREHGISVSSSATCNRLRNAKTLATTTEEGVLRVTLIIFVGSGLVHGPCLEQELILSRHLDNVIVWPSELG